MKRRFKPTLQLRRWPRELDDDRPDEFADLVDLVWDLLRYSADQAREVNGQVADFSYMICDAIRMAR